MKHQMKLWNEPFNKITSKTKTVEMRLNDEKRSLIQVNDIIEFINVETNEIINVKVKKLNKYKDFKELYSHYDKVAIGYNEDENESYLDMLQYYKEEDVEKYGALAIEIEVI